MLVHTAQQLANVPSSGNTMTEIRLAEKRRTIHVMVAHVTAPTAALLDVLPAWVTLLRAPNPGPMTLDGTNTWILREHGVVIDPGPLDEGHLAAVAEQEHTSIRQILVTHGHFDHVEGAARLSELLGGVPVAAADPAHCVDAEPLRDGDDVNGIRVVAVPGHTSDSVAFVADGVVFTGDTVLGRGTTVVAWPDGNLGDYLASLERLETLGKVPVLPGHGPALADCAVAARFYRDHRLARLDQVRATGERDAERIVEIVYADVDRALWPAAEASVRAQLAYLELAP
jgi:glyoxylase-like metal-dependent hydrolase (beta-lactamase superfamily II)